MKVDKLVIECHIEYLGSLTDPIKKLILLEAIKDMQSPEHDPRLLISNLNNKTGYNRKTITKTLREASKSKNKSIFPHLIAETIEPL